MQVWCIIDQRGDLVLEANRKVPRLYATRQRAEEKIKITFQVGKWQVRLVRLTII